jgi:formylglycine-generating enzyme required for sulfatase activity
MLLAHVEDLVNSKITDWSEYGVYDALVQAWLDREQRKLRKQGRHDIAAASLYRGCLLVAAQMGRNRSRFLTEAQLDERMQDHPELKSLTEIKFGGRSLLNRNAAGDYRFSHFSIQEFLEARQVMEAGAHHDRLEIPPPASEKVIRFVLDGRAKVCPGKPLILRGLNLTRFDLKGLDLRDCDFSDSDVSGADLSSARLDRAVLRNTRLTGANLAGVSLTQPIEGLPFQHILNHIVALEFAWIPPGVFLRGQDGDERLQVALSRGFWMGKYPVTQRQYEALTGSNPSHFKKSGLDAPVESVNWNEAAAFCADLSRRPRETGGPPCVVCRLPTEAEWEYACRAGSQKKYCFGDDESELEAYAWYGGNSGEKTHPVGEKKPNARGLYDMHGNVWEWCQDWYGPYPKAPVTDPTGPTEPTIDESRVLRGGSFNGDPDYLRCSCRRGNDPDGRSRRIGFRVVCVGGSAG